MIRMVVLVAIIVAFVGGRFTAPKPHGMPSVPIAFLQMTQPIAVTIHVDLDSPLELVEGSSDHYDLRGTVEYRFTNISDDPVGLAFPPVRTISITSRSVDHDDTACPSCLADQQTVNIPPHKYITFKEDWSGIMGGDMDSALQPSAGSRGFTFRPPKNAEPGVNFCNDTLIGFRTFSHGTPNYGWHAIDGHLRLVAGDVELKPHPMNGVISEPPSP